MSIARKKNGLFARLRAEQLEDRLTPSWGGTPPASLAIPAAFTAVNLNASGDALGTAAITANEIDWYRFTVSAGAATFSATTPSSSLDTVIGIYNANGQRVAFNDDIAYPSNTDSRASVTLSAGTYYFGITNFTGTAGGAYSWSIDGPAATSPPPVPPTPPPPTDDAFENNDTAATASNLGTLSSTQIVTGLVMADAADYFKFTTVATGTASSSVTITFTHALGDLDMRVLNAAGTQVGISQGVGNSETISLNGLPAGTYTVHIYGYNGVFNPSYTLTVNAPPPLAPPPPAPPPPAPPPPTTGGFAVTLRMTGLTTNQQAIFQQAANRWAQVITGDLPDAVFSGTSQYAAANVDDVLIEASGANIDGVGNILGQAGPDRFRSGSMLPYHGVMQFDSADMASLEASGGLYYVVLHEMGHVLGIGTIWSSLGLLQGAGTTNPLFIGPQATAAYNAIFGTNATGVPVENSGGSGTRDSHWRESVFNNELMTGYLNNGVNPLSRVTVASLADLGYNVNLNAADNYP